MSDKKEHEQQRCPRPEEKKNDTSDVAEDCDSDRMVFPDEREKPPSVASRNFASSNTNPGYGTDANGEIVEEFK